MRWRWFPAGRSRFSKDHRISKPLTLPTQPSPSASPAPGPLGYPVVFQRQGVGRGRSLHWHDQFRAHDFRRSILGHRIVFSPRQQRFGSVGSTSAVLTVISPPFITQQPANRTVRAGSDVTFSAAANGTPPLRYQWHLTAVRLQAPSAPRSISAMSNPPSRVLSPERHQSLRDERAQPRRAERDGFPAVFPALPEQSSGRHRRQHGIVRNRA